MRLSPYSRRVVAPSADLLLFLRKQADAVCFFTSAAPGFIPKTTQTTGCISKTLMNSRLSVRCLTTSPRRLATLETSLLNLDFLTQPEALQLPFFKKVSRPAIVINHKSQDGHSAVRWQSTESEETQWRKWLGSKVTEQVNSADISSMPSSYSSSTNDSALRSLLKAAPSDLRLRCTEFDENGKAVVTNGEFKKQELIAKVCDINLERSKAYSFSMVFFLVI